MQVLTNQEFTYRESPTESDGLAKITDIKGNTLVWNQLIQNGNFADTSNWSAESGVTFSVSNSIATISSTTTNNGIRQYFSNPLTVNHKYLIKAEFNVPTEYRCVIGTAANQGVQVDKLISTANTWTEVIGIRTCTIATTSFYCYVRGTTYENVKIRNVMCFDLTQMGLDISNPSDFTSLFPLSYYSYNQGSLLSFNGNGIKTVGKNLVSSYQSKLGVNQYGIALYCEAVIKPNTTYSISFVGQSGLSVYPNENMFTSQSWISMNGQRQTVTLTTKSDISNQHMADGWGIFKKASGSSIPFATAFVDVQIEVGSTATSYVPYTSSTLFLPVSTYFPNGMNGVGTDYDELTKSKAYHRMARVDLGSLIWTRLAINEGYAFSSNVIDNLKLTGNDDTANALCANYTLSMVGNGYSMPNDKSFRVGGTYFGLKRLAIRDDSYTDATAFTTAMNGVYLVYPLATPTETPITTPQSKDEYPFFKSYKGGTEQLLPENGSVPVTAPIICDLMYSSGAIQVTTYPNPEQGGETSGDGWYLVGEEATVNALPNEHYAFNNWVLDGEIVSTDPEYTFEVKDE